MDSMDSVRQRIEQVLNDHPLLNDYGNGRSHDMPRATVDADGLRSAIHAERERLRTDASLGNIVAAHAWIVVNMRESRGICKTYSSYGLKHIFEADTGVYVSNGEFCVAMLLGGFNMGTGFNPSFNIMRSSVDAALRRYNKRGRVNA